MTATTADEYRTAARVLRDWADEGDYDREAELLDTEADKLNGEAAAAEARIERLAAIRWNTAHNTRESNPFSWDALGPVARAAELEGMRAVLDAIATEADLITDPVEAANHVARIEGPWETLADIPDDVNEVYSSRGSTIYYRRGWVEVDGMRPVAIRDPRLEGPFRLDEMPF